MKLEEQKRRIEQKAIGKLKGKITKLLGEMPFFTTDITHSIGGKKTLLEIYGYDKKMPMAIVDNERAVKWIKKASKTYQEISKL